MPPPAEPIPTELRLPKALHAAVVAHLEAALPLEAVGLLATVADGSTERAVAFYPGRNADASATRYTMEPVDVLAAFDDMARRGWRFGAIVHSHPASPPVPSATDLREAFYPDAAMVIVGFASASPELRAWSIRSGSPRPIAVVVAG